MSVGDEPGGGGGLVARVIEASVRNRFLVLLLTAMVIVAGIWALLTTPVDAIPDLSDVQVIVVTEYPGQEPQVVEDQVTYPLSTAMLSVPYAETVRGYSFFGLSMVYIIFEDGTDLYWARSRVLEYLNVARARLPEGTTPQLGPDATGVGWVYQYTLTDFGPRTQVLRDGLDADGLGTVELGELPEPDDLSVVGGREQCARELLGLCLQTEVDGGKAIRVYADDQLRALFETDDPPGIAGPDVFVEDSLGFLRSGFDRDGDQRISQAELHRAANFQGLDLQQLRSLQDWYFRYELMALDGVSEVASVGGFVKQYQVEVDPEKLRSYGVSLAAVKKAIQRSNTAVGGRLIEMAETEYMVRGEGYIESIADLEQIPVGMVVETHTPILLRQVADIHTGPELRRGLVEMDGEGEVVSGIVVMRFGDNALEVIERVETRLSELEPGLPEGVEIHTSYDRSGLIHRAIDTLRDKLIEEMIVVALIIILFLLHGRSAFVAIFTIPTGVLISLLTMRLLGLNANIMSLGGIAIAIGVMVDASVVMVENLHKHKERGGDATHLQLVLRSAREVGPALFFSLLIITVSFLPVFTLEQQEGRLFTPLAFTKTFAMAGSALLAVTVVPVLMYYFVRGKIRAEKDNPLSRFFIWIYRPVIRAVLRFPVATVLVALGLVAVTVVPLTRLGGEFMPPLNEGDLLYMPTTPPGISITKAKELLQQTDKIIASHPQVDHVLGKAGRAETATDPAPLSMLETTIILAPQEEWPKGKTIEDIAAELDQMVDFPGLTNAWTMPIKTRIDMLATGIKTPVGVKLMGDDLTELAAVGEQIEAALRELPETDSVYSERVVGGHYVDIDIRRGHAARFGLTVADVQDVVSSAIGGMNVTWTVEGLERYPVNVRFPRELRDNLQALERVAVHTPMGHTVPLGQVADISIAEGPPMIKSENARQTAWVFITPDSSDIGGYVRKARKVVAEQVVLPSGVSIVWSGQYEYMQRANKRLALMIPLTLALIFILLYLHFRSAVESSIVMASLPFALVGGVWLLWALDYNLSVAVGVGFIALAGLAAETGVVMLVYLDEALRRYRREGRLETVDDLRAAITEGAVDRVRPKLMTVATTTLGLLPVMFGTETGIRVMQRIATPMVGGLISSTVLTLVILPAIYLIWKRRRLQ
jgi:copper/silver efflux system protein